MPTSSLCGRQKGETILHVDGTLKDHNHILEEIANDPSTIEVVSERRLVADLRLSDGQLLLGKCLVFHVFLPAPGLKSFLTILVDKGMTTIDDRESVDQSSELGRIRT